MESGGGGEMAEEAMTVAGAVEEGPKEETVAFRGDEAHNEESAALGSGGGEDAPGEDPGIGEAEDPNEEGSAALGIEEEAAGLGIGGGEDGPEEEPGAEVVALNDDMIALVLARLPSAEQYRFSELAREWRYFVTEPFYLKYHLYPPPMAFSVLPAALLVQPKDLRRGYVHLLVVSTFDRRNRYESNIGVHPKYNEFAEDAPITRHMPLPRGCLVEFLEKTVPMLDMCFVASYGSILLAKSPTTLFLCIPATGRWIKLPSRRKATLHLGSATASTTT